MSKIVCVFLLLCLCFTGAFCEEAVDPVNPDEGAASGEGLDHTGVIIAPVVSAALVALFMIEDAVFELVDWGNMEYYLSVGTGFAIHFPLYTVSPLKGLVATGVAGGCYAAYELTAEEDVEFFRSFLYTGIFQTGLYSTYVSYSDNRVKAKSGVYNDDWRKDTFVSQIGDSFGLGDDVYEKWEPYTLADLIASPFKPENLFDPMVYIFPIAGVISPLIVNSHDNAPWTTGEMYVGNWQMNPFLAIPLMLGFFFVESSAIAISEDSHFRGFIYEEVGSNYGHIAAKITDCIYFPAVHIPQEIFIAEYDGLTIAKNFLGRSVLTFYLDNLYDRGGLERTVAAHFWIDFPLLFMQWLMASGSPQEDISAILSLLPEIRIRLPLDY